MSQDPLDLLSTVALILGSNLGDRAAYLRSGCELLGSRALGIAGASDLFETQPVECGPQPPYLNQVLLGSTRHAPSALLGICQGVERQLGRRRAAPHAPRTLDVDLLFLGTLVLNTPRLTLPHPALPRRRSILVPLAQMAPAWRHPVLGKTVLELLAECKDPGWVKEWRG